MGSFRSESIANRMTLFFHKKKKSELIFTSTDAVLKIPDHLREEKVYTFYKVAEDWHTAYDVIQPYRDYIKLEFNKILNPKILKRLEKHKLPVLSIHARKGDFKRLGENETLDPSVIATQTPNTYFKRIINDIRKFLGINIPVTIFTDGRADELEELLSMENVKMAKNDLDIVHLLLLSKSKIIVFSEGSTFSGWAGFLSEAVLIRNKMHFRKTVRDGLVNDSVYEGYLPEAEQHWPELLKNNLISISKQLEKENT